MSCEFGDIPEANAIVERLFAALDQNASGTLDYDELKVAHDRIVHFNDHDDSTSAQRHTPRDNGGHFFQDMFYGDRSLNVFKRMHHEVGKEEFVAFCEAAYQVSGRKKFFQAAESWERAISSGCPVARGKAPVHVLPRPPPVRNHQDLPGCPFAGRPPPMGNRSSLGEGIPPGALYATERQKHSMAQEAAAEAMSALPGSGDILEDAQNRCREMEKRLSRLKEAREGHAQEDGQEEGVDEAPLEEQVQAATAIQARWKGKKARAEMSKQQKKKQKEEHATGVDDFWELLTSSGASGAGSRASGGMVSTHLPLEVIVILHEDAALMGLQETIHLQSKFNKAKLTQVTVADYKAGQGRYGEGGESQPDEATLCTSMQLAKLAFAIHENNKLDLEACRAVVNSVPASSKRPARSDWMDLSMDLGTFRALVRTLAGLAGVPVDLLIAQLLFARSRRFECAEVHVDMLFQKANKRKRYDQETGELIHDPLTLSDFIKLCREANLLDATGRKGIREPELQLLFLDTLRKLPDLLRERADQAVGLAKKGKVDRHVHTGTGGDGFIGRTEVSILFHRLWEKLGDKAGFKSPLQILHRLLDEKEDEFAHHHDHHAKHQEDHEVPSLLKLDVCAGSSIPAGATPDAAWELLQAQLPAEDHEDTSDLLEHPSSARGRSRPSSAGGREKRSNSKKRSSSGGKERPSLESGAAKKPGSRPSSRPSSAARKQKKSKPGAESSSAAWEVASHVSCDPDLEAAPGSDLG